jgi:DNA-binding transcriptional LysR family regulator
MEMHQVRCFLALCDELNFTRAAARVDVSQPSLTRAIKMLEAELGGPLFRGSALRPYTRANATTGSSQWPPAELASPSCRHCALTEAV